MHIFFPVKPYHILTHVHPYFPISFQYFSIPSHQFLWVFYGFLWFFHGFSMGFLVVDLRGLAPVLSAPSATTAATERALRCWLDVASAVEEANRRNAGATRNGGKKSIGKTCEWITVNMIYMINVEKNDLLIYHLSSWSINLLRIVKLCFYESNSNDLFDTAMVYLYSEVEESMNLSTSNLSMIYLWNRESIPHE